MAKAVKKPGTALVKWDEELAKHAKEAAQTEASAMGGSFISTRGGVFTFNGGEVPGGKMTVIVLDHVIEHHFYNTRYNPDAPSSPVCFAFARADDDLKPHEQSAEPQHDTCAGCPNNEFGTAETGRGKACANIRRLALLTEDGLEDIGAASIAMLKVPVTSVKAWAGYVNQLADVMKRPPFAVLTEVSIHKDPKTQFKLQFKLLEKIEDGDVLAALMEKRKAAARDLVMPYQPPSEDPLPAKGGKAKPQVKAGTRFKGR